MGTYTQAAGSHAFVARPGSAGEPFIDGNPISGGGLYLHGQFTNWIYFSDFGFTIPPTETISGISVSYPVLGIQTVPFTDQEAADSSVLLWNLAAPIVGQIDHAQPATYYNNTIITAEGRGAVNDLWGLSGISTVEANGSTFGFGISIQFVTGTEFPFPGPPAISFDVSPVPTITITTRPAYLVNDLPSGSGNGTDCFNTNTDWTLNLGFTPTPGNLLVLFVALINGIDVLSVSFAGHAMMLAYSSGTTHSGILVASIIVPAGSGSTMEMVFGSGGFQFCSIVQEIGGVDSAATDKTHSQSNTGTPFDTGLTAMTTVDREFWANTYPYYNASTGMDSEGASPTNGYDLVNNGAPVKHFDTGWTWKVGPPTTSAPTVSAGLLMSTQVVSVKGTAGGAITDSSGNTNLSYASAVTFGFAPATPGVYPPGSLMRVAPNMPVGGVKIF